MVAKQLRPGGGIQPIARFGVDNAPPDVARAMTKRKGGKAAGKTTMRTVSVKRAR